jgi:hypothetical protein
MNNKENSTFPLACRLKKQYIHVKNLQKGDFVITGEIFWEVASITQENHGFMTVLDDKDNGFVMSPGEEICQIIHRGCFGV